MLENSAAAAQLYSEAGAGANGNDAANAGGAAGAYQGYRPAGADSWQQERQSQTGSDGGDDQQALERDAKSAALERYDLRLPEGTVVDEAMMGHFTALAKEFHLDNAGAQKWADLHMKAVGAYATRAAAELEAQRASDAEAVTKDPELGGRKLEGTMQQVWKILGKRDGTMKGLSIPGVDNAKLMDLLVQRGLDNNPMLIRLFHFFGGFVGDDNTFVGTHVGGGGAPRRPEDVLYGRR